ncbi:MAG: hypothetical protein BWX71_00769 [Deltaproteobacteria bacterium ADurb.Bin072]|nr:MAG: hypothetical protein BWX71_00769 [Deltaproteobacteria bacterium ADurb.Bin072]
MEQDIQVEPIRRQIVIADEARGDDGEKEKS